jgi:hypothetical protein
MHGITAPRRRDAWRAALYCGVYTGAIMAWNISANVARGERGVAVLLLAAVFWGSISAAVGTAAVYAGATWRAENGGWQISPMFAALAVGTPAAALAGALLLARRCRAGAP